MHDSKKRYTQYQVTDPQPTMSIFCTSPILTHQFSSLFLLCSHNINVFILFIYFFWRLITTNVIIYVTNRDRPCNILTQVAITCFTRHQVCVCKLVNCSQFLSFFSLLPRPQADGDSSPTSKLHRLLAESRQMVQNLEQSTTFSLSGSPKQVSFFEKVFNRRASNLCTITSTLSNET